MSSLNPHFPLPFQRTTATATTPSGVSRPGLVSRFIRWISDPARIDALIDARQRAVDARISRHLSRTGVDRLTDSVERDIARLL